MSEIPEISRENEQDAHGALADRIRKEAKDGRKDLLLKTLTGRKVTVILPRDQNTGKEKGWQSQYPLRLREKPGKTKELNGIAENAQLTILDGPETTQDGGKEHYWYKISVDNKNALRFQGDSNSQVGWVSAEFVQLNKIEKTMTDKPVSGATDKPVSGATDKPVSGATDKPVSGATDKPVSGATDKPVSGATDKPVSGATDKPVSGATDKPVSGATDKPVSGATDKPVSGATDKPVSGATDKPVSGATDKPVSGATDKPVSGATDKPVSGATDKPVSGATDKPVSGATDKPVSGATDKPVSGATDKPVSGATDKPVSGATDKPVSGATDKPVSGATDKPVSGATDKPVSGATDKPVSGATDKPVSGATLISALGKLKERGEGYMIGSNEQWDSAKRKIIEVVGVAQMTELLKEPKIKYFPDSLSSLTDPTKTGGTKLFQIIASSNHPEKNVLIGNLVFKDLPGGIDAYNAYEGLYDEYLKVKDNNGMTPDKFLRQYAPTSVAPVAPTAPTSTPAEEKNDYYEDFDKDYVGFKDMINELDKSGSFKLKQLILKNHNKESKTSNFKLKRDDKNGGDVGLEEIEYKDGNVIITNSSGDITYKLINHKFTIIKEETIKFITDKGELPFSIKE